MFMNKSGEIVYTRVSEGGGSRACIILVFLPKHIVQKYHF